MKKVVTLAVSLVMLFALLAGCGGGNGDNGGNERLIEIGDRLFIMQVDNIYTNAQRYLGRMVQLQGIFETHHWEGETFHIVFRNAPGCCGDDGVVGFQLDLDGTPPLADNAWVEVTGELERFGPNPNEIRLRVTNIEEMAERGIEFVNQ